MFNLFGVMFLNHMSFEDKGFEALWYGKYCNVFPSHEA